MAASAWIMNTRSRQQIWEGSGQINAEHNFLNGRELYGIYIFFRFIVDVWKGSSNKTDRIRIRCNNPTGILDNSQTVLKQNNSKQLAKY